MLHGAVHVGVAHEDLAVDVLDPCNGVVLVASTTQTDHVHAHITERLAGGFHERRYVLAHQAGTCNEAVRPDVDELLHGDVPFQDGPIVDGDVPCQIHAVGDHHVAAHDAIMGEVYIRHQKGVAAHGGLQPVRSAPVDGDAFADGTAIAHFGGGLLASELQVLRYGTDHGAGEDAAVATDARAIQQHCVGPDPTAIADLDIAVDAGERFYGDVLAQFGIGVDVRELGDRHQAVALALTGSAETGFFTICAIISASTANWPFT